MSAQDVAAAVVEFFADEAVDVRVDMAASPPEVAIDHDGVWARLCGPAGARIRQLQAHLGFEVQAYGSIRPRCKGKGRRR